MATVGWILLIIVVSLLFWVHYRSGMRLTDRINIALEILANADFKPADGFDAAKKEDPDLVGWIKSGEECVMLFRKQAGPDTIEIVDIASPSFHPGLVIHYRNGVATRGDGKEIKDPYVRQLAGKLLRETRRRVLAACTPVFEVTDGFRY